MNVLRTDICVRLRVGRFLYALKEVIVHDLHISC